MHLLLLGVLACFAPRIQGYTALSDTSLRDLPSPGADFDIKTGKLLAPILIPRVPGTAGSTQVLTHFVDFFQQTLPAWNITFQNSTGTTPTSNGKQVPFVNLIAHRDPPWARPGDAGRLNLVAHYDSLSKPEGFIGAIDSAAPCAMIMHAVRSIDEALTRKWTSMQAGDDGLADFGDTKGIQVLFLDGEEAFLAWSDTDSLYGARSLAEEWESTINPVLSTYRSPLESIELFVLLDLLGAKGTQVPSFFKTTHWAYMRMADIESRLRRLAQFRSASNHPSKRDSKDARQIDTVFLSEKNKPDNAPWLGGHVGDDHLPFMHRGVNILHLIPVDFPQVWHTIKDDGEHLHGDTVEDWSKLITAFAAEWMDLEGFMSAESPAGRSDQTAGTDQGTDAKDEFGNV